MNDGTIDRDALVKWVVQRSMWTKPAPAVMYGLNLEVAPEQERSAPITMRPFQMPKNASASDREAEARDLVDEFIREAEGCSATMPRLQRYSITAHYTEDPGVDPMARTFFVMKPTGDFVDPAAQDPRDVVGNLQRLTSDALRHQGSNMQHVMDLLVEDHKDMRLHLRATERSLIEAVQAREKAMSEATTREIAVKEAQMMIDLKLQAFGLFEKWVVKRMLANSDGAPKSLIDSRGLTDFLVTLTKPQQEVFVKSLLPGIKSAMSPAEQEAFKRAISGAHAGANGAARTGGDPS